MENSWQITEARKRHETRRREEIAKLGEENYRRRQAAKRAVFEELRERLDTLANNAKARGFVYFRARLNLGGPAEITLRLQFADGNGKFYEHSIGLERLIQKHLGTAVLMEYSDIENLVHLYIRNLPGIEMLRRGMQSERVRASKS